MKKLAIATMLIIATFPLNVSAHRDDYLDETFVFLTLQRMEFEPEYWLDYGYSQNQEQRFFRNNIAAEYGITEHWMIDGRGTLQSDIGQNSFFSGGRIETRFRFGEENEMPVDIAASMEFSSVKEINHWHYALEPKLILSKDFSENTNLTLNLTEEISLHNHQGSFNAAMGFRQHITDIVRLGVETKYDFEEKSGSLVPQIWFAFVHDITFITGFSKGIENNKTNFVRVAFEVGF